MEDVNGVVVATNLAIYSTADRIGFYEFSNFVAVLLAHPVIEFICQNNIIFSLFAKIIEFSYQVNDTFLYKLFRSGNFIREHDFLAFGEIYPPYPLSLNPPRSLLTPYFLC